MREGQLRWGKAPRPGAPVGEYRIFEREGLDAEALELCIVQIRAWSAHFERSSGWPGPDGAHLRLPVVAPDVVWWLTVEGHRALEPGERGRPWLDLACAVRPARPHPIEPDPAWPFPVPRDLMSLVTLASHVPETLLHGLPARVGAEAFLESGAPGDIAAPWPVRAPAVVDRVRLVTFIRERLAEQDVASRQDGISAWLASGVGAAPVLAGGDEWDIAAGFLDRSDPEIGTRALQLLAPAIDTSAFRNWLSHRESAWVAVLALQDRAMDLAYVVQSGPLRRWAPELPPVLEDRCMRLLTKLAVEAPSRARRLARLRPRPPLIERWAERDPLALEALLRPTR